MTDTRLWTDVCWRCENCAASTQTTYELRYVVDSLPGLIWTALPDGCIEFVNLRWCEYTGLSLDETCGTGWYTVIHPSDLPELLDRWESITASGQPGEVEARLRRFDGKYRWFLFRVCPVTDASGQIAKWCGINIDIEDRRQAEETVRMQERRFRLIVDSLPALIAFVTPEGNLESANGHHLEYYGKTIEELQVFSRTGFNFHPDDRADLLAKLMASFEAGHPCDHETRSRGVDGIYHWFRTRGMPLRDTDGRIILWFFSQIDIDEQKRAEALLAGERRLLEMVAGGYSMSRILEALCQLVESTIIGCYCSVALVDPSGTRLEYGVAPSLPADFITSIVDRPVSVDSGPYGMAVCLNEQVISSDFNSETRWTPYEWYSMTLAHGLQACWAAPISSVAGKVLGAFAIFYGEPRTPTSRDQNVVEQVTNIVRIAIARTQDVTQHRISEEALANARSDLAHVARVTSLGALAASIAHEVNQPLSGIITNASTCLRMLAADPPNVIGARDTARRTIRDGHRASEVITRLRALFSKKAAVTEPVDLNEAALEVIALARSELQRSRVILCVELAEGLPPVTGDRVQLQQVILNLLLNASDAMTDVEDRLRQLSIRTEQDDGDLVCLSVQDSGVGFGMQNADSLFEPFYTTKNGGMGIGLSVSRSIIESHHGRLWAASNDGPGAKFSFSLPRRAEISTVA